MGLPLPMFTMRSDWRPRAQRALAVGAQRSTSVCFTHTPCQELRDDRLEPPLGLLYLATVAQRDGHHTALIDLSSTSASELEAQLPAGYNVYGFSTYSVNYGSTCQLARAVRRRNPGAVLIAGGPHASALPEQVLRDGFDVVVTGEGEVAIREILAAIATGDHVAGVVEGAPPDPLDDLPFPDFGMIDLSTYTRQVDGHACVSLLSSRGCPYRCTFCNSNIMGAGRPMRYRSAENVVAEIRSIKDRYGIRHFRFQDDIFTIHPRRVSELTAKLRAEDIVYRCFARINTCASHRSVTSDLRASGCVHVSFGVESGSPTLLARHAMHKDQTPEQIRAALTNAAEAGLRIRIFLIVGFPGENDDTVGETLSLIKSCPWDEFAVYPLIAYPGTPLHDAPEEYGITHIDRTYSDYLQIGRNFKAGFTLRTATFDEEDVRLWRDHVIAELLADGRTWAGNAEGFK